MPMKKRIVSATESQREPLHSMACETYKDQQGY
jgi:hypothetical protein